MRRNPSIKQQFIKKYAKLVYGPQGNSKSLTAQERAMIKQLFEGELPDLIDFLAYADWLANNIESIMTNQRKQRRLNNFDNSKPGPFLLQRYFFCTYQNSYTYIRQARQAPTSLSEATQ